MFQAGRWSQNMEWTMLLFSVTARILPDRIFGNDTLPNAGVEAKTWPIRLAADTRGFISVTFFVIARAVVSRTLEQVFFVTSHHRGFVRSHLDQVRAVGSVRHQRTARPV